MLARERTCYLCPSLLDRWHLQCAAGLDSLAMGDLAATPCDRSLGCGATPSTYPAGYALLVARGIGLASGTTAELSASCLVPMAMCLSPFPVLLRIGLLVRLSCCVALARLLAERHLSIPELLRRLALAVRYGALQSWRPQCAVCAQAHLTEDGLSPGCSARVARTDEQHRWLLRTMACLGCYLSRIS